MSSEQELLKTVLEPLLEDFQYWFSRSRSLLESERLSFFTVEEQAQLLEQVKKSQQEVSTAQMLFKATDGQAGIESRMLVPWHHLVAQCWDVARRWRELKAQDSQS
ncbi:Protein of unknown function DUF2605 [Stanieria cyanosphaera PCC 7437]|uniref:DUF2605 domain-containing protein n=1 Tax=Stanieria cyanosphaera (strain ATCC 29371 / PCC 7437) TaxID=111780 RepID=K9XPT5_STAC7|nr:DUF2605 domain-containing protein [Stanieria cyanosphaera]AFZ33682.1 Protein of unknown function DUF2605 [Stanieria cyanosphaera PCC 7437]